LLDQDAAYNWKIGVTRVTAARQSMFRPGGGPRPWGCWPR
jgi:hypothetical protein